MEVMNILIKYILLYLNFTSTEPSLRCYLIISSKSDGTMELASLHLKKNKVKMV